MRSLVALVLLASMVAGCVSGPRADPDADQSVPTDALPEAAGTANMPLAEAPVRTDVRALNWTAPLTGDVAIRIDVVLPGGGECTQRFAAETFAEDTQARFLSITEHPDGQFDWYHVTGAHLMGVHAAGQDITADPPVADASRERPSSFTHAKQPFPETFTTWAFAHGLTELGDYVENGTASYGLVCDNPFTVTLHGSRFAYLFDAATVTDGVGYNVGLASSANLLENHALEVPSEQAVRLLLDEFGAVGAVRWDGPEPETWVFDAEDDTLRWGLTEGAEHHWTVDQSQPYYGGFVGAVAALEPLASLDDLIDGNG